MSKREVDETVVAFILRNVTSRGITDVPPNPEGFSAVSASPNIMYMECIFC